MFNFADPDPEQSRHHEEFHRLLREETDRLAGGPLPEYADDDPVLRGAGTEFDNMVRKASADLRQPDRVPLTRQQTDWAAFGNRPRGSGIRFRSAEITDDGVITVDQPVALAVPLGVDPPRAD
jgi:hypothetical protein